MSSVGFYCKSKKSSIEPEGSVIPNKPSLVKYVNKKQKLFKQDSLPRMKVKGKVKEKSPLKGGRAGLVD